MKITDESIIKFGLATILGAIILLWFGFYMWGEIHNTYHLKLSSELVECYKWTLGALFGGLAASGLTTALVAARKGNVKLIEVEADDDDDDEE